MPASNLKVSIAELLKKEGYISDAKVEGDGAKKLLNLTLRYAEGDSAIEMIERVSRPGRRVYCNVDDMPRVRGGLGVVMVSTSKGLLTDKDARSAGVGGEVICRVF
jgi:small subunit ribosomal protein S8